MHGMTQANQANGQVKTRGYSGKHRANSRSKSLSDNKGQPDHQQIAGSSEQRSQYQNLQRAQANHQHSHSVDRQPQPHHQMYANNAIANNKMNLKKPTQQSGFSSSQTQSHPTFSGNLSGKKPQEQESSQLSSGGTVYVKQFGQSSLAGNVGRIGSSKINQDSTFASKMGPEPLNGMKDNMKLGIHNIEWFVSVADGHGANGHFVSQFIAQTMPKQFEHEKKKIERQKQTAKTTKNGANELSESELVDPRIKKALIATFLQVQNKLEKQTNFDCSLSGSTVVGCYQSGNHFYFANAGDSRAIIIGETFDHN